MAHMSSLANCSVLPCAARNVYSLQSTRCTQCTLYTAVEIIDTKIYLFEEHLNLMITIPET